MTIGLFHFSGTVCPARSARKYRLLLREVKRQDAILKLGPDIFFLDILADIEASGHGAFVQAAKSFLRRLYFYVDHYLQSRLPCLHSNGAQSFSIRRVN